MRIDFNQDGSIKKLLVNGEKTMRMMFLLKIMDWVCISIKLLGLMI